MQNGDYRMQITDRLFLSYYLGGNILYKKFK